MLAKMSVGRVCWLTVPPVCWFFSYLVECWVVVIVLMRVRHMVSKMAVSWVHMAVGEMAVD